MNDAALAKGLGGKFIVFDGPDGAGKTTQRDRVAEFLHGAGMEPVCCRDPGGTEIGDRIRSVLLDHDLSDMHPGCEALLFMASRAQLVGEVIAPALSEGRTVLCDRFVSSTCAYQGAAGYPPEETIKLAHFAIGDHWPDLTLVFDVDPADGMARVGRKPSHAGKNRARDAGQEMLIPGARPDAMEARPLEFHRRVREIFVSLPDLYPSPVRVVEGGGAVEEVHGLVLAALRSYCGG